jgi:ABC-2 type transport system permease protein
MPMSKVLAMVRHDLLTRASYRFQSLISFISLFSLIIPFYFAADALQPMMERSIAGQADHYFPFLLIGMIAMRLVMSSTNVLPRAFGSAIRSGTLEAIFSTPTSLLVPVLGMAGFPLLWTVAESCILLAVGVVLGVQLVLPNLLLGLVILSMIVLTYLSFGIFGIALVLVFRTTGPLLSGVIAATTLLGGIYYPTHVIPSWIQHLSALLPMTYGLRALRQTVLEGASLESISTDLAILCAFLVVLLSTSWGLLHLALQHARRAGTLAQY